MLRLGLRLVRGEEHGQRHFDSSCSRHFRGDRVRNSELPDEAPLQARAELKGENDYERD